MKNTEQNFKWSEIVKQVEGTASSFQQKQVTSKKMQEYAYKQSLDNQVSSLKKMRDRSIRSEKQKDLRTVNESVVKQQKDENMKRMERLGIERYYQQQNQNKARKQREKKGQIPPIRSSAFLDEMLIKAEKRGDRTHKNFELQQSINLLQSENKKEEITRMKERDIERDEQYNRYMDRQYRKKEFERELWKNKYIRNQSLQQFPTKIDDKAMYRSFLDQQVRSTRQIRQKEKDQIIQGRLKLFNLSAQKPNFSPAYIGRVSMSFDKEKQNDILNQHLFKDLQKSQKYNILQTVLGDSPKKQQRIYEQKQSSVTGSSLRTSNQTGTSIRNKYRVYNVLSGQKQIYHV